MRQSVPIVQLVILTPEFQLQDFHRFTIQFATVSRLYDHNEACSVTYSDLHQQQRFVLLLSFVFQHTLSDWQHASYLGASGHRFVYSESLLIINEYFVAPAALYWIFIHIINHLTRFILYMYHRQDIWLCLVTVTWDFILLNSIYLGFSLVSVHMADSMS